MKIGAMNHPGKDLAEEIRWIGRNGFDFIDLTLEPPCARAEDVEAGMVKDLTGEFGLEIVGHTTPFLPFASPYESVRRNCVDVIVRSLDLFAELNVKTANMHLDHRRGAESEAENIANNRWSLREAFQAAQERGIRLMMEHFGKIYSEVGNLRKILDEIPGLGFHLDVGHANLWRSKNYADELLDAFGDRLCHVHVSDNHGGDRDEHLPLGAGNIDWAWAVGQLKRIGYDGTVTAEVFSPDRDFLLAARDKLRLLWEEIPPLSERSSATR
jgi:sugar phosphate isomerase/epimerase